MCFLSDCAFLDPVSKLGDKLVDEVFCFSEQELFCGLLTECLDQEVFTEIGELVKQSLDAALFAF